MNQYLLEKYFSSDEVQNDTEEMRAVRDDEMEFSEVDEPNMCKEEVIDIIRKEKKQQATAFRMKPWVLSLKPFGKK